MKVHFYGTGASEGFPAMFCMCEYCQAARRLKGKNIRTRTGAQVDESILIDFSVDAFSHIVYGGLDIGKIEYILLTHSHTDHFLANNVVNALPPMVSANAVNHKYQFFGNQKCAELFELALSDKTDVQEYLSFTVLEDNKPIRLGDYTVTPIATIHDPKEECFIYCIEKDGKTLLYGHDTAMFTEETWAKLSKYVFSCVVLDCTSIMKANEFASHMSFHDNLAVKARMLADGMANAETSFISTHFAHTFNPLHKRLEEEMRPYGFAPAFDGMDHTF